MTDIVELSPSDILSDKPFTHPDNNETDLAVMRRVIESVRQIVANTDQLPAQSHSHVTIRNEPDGRTFRIVLTQLPLLKAPHDLTIVGFFGHRRHDADPTVVDGIDVKLIDEFPKHPGVLSYCSMELEGGNWGNVVMLNPPEAKDRWRTSELHSHAVTLAPDYYEGIRLHNGILIGGLTSGQDVKLIRTKYYYFGGDEPWRAERQLTP